MDEDFESSDIEMILFLRRMQRSPRSIEEDRNGTKESKQATTTGKDGDEKKSMADAFNLPL